MYCMGDSGSNSEVTYAVGDGGSKAGGVYDLGNDYLDVSVAAMPARTVCIYIATFPRDTVCIGVWHGAQ